MTVGCTLKLTITQDAIESLSFRRQCMLGLVSVATARSGLGLSVATANRGLSRAHVCCTSCSIEHVALVPRGRRLYSCAGYSMGYDRIRELPLPLCARRRTLASYSYLSREQHGIRFICRNGQPGHESSTHILYKVQRKPRCSCVGWPWDVLLRWSSCRIRRNP